VVEGSLEDHGLIGLYSKDGRLNAAILCNQPYRLRTYHAVVNAGIVPAPPAASAQLAQSR
jgi:hypothetical protein